MKNYNDLYSNNNSNNKKSLNLLSLNPNNQTFSHSKTTIFDALQNNILIAVLLFVLGFLGPSIISIIVNEIIKDTYSVFMSNFLLNFIPYILTFTAMLAIILSVPYLRKNIFNHQFSQRSYLALFTFICLIIFYIGNILISVVTSYFTTRSNNNQNSIEDLIYLSPLLTTIMTVVFAPVVEEMTYRASLFAFFGHKHKYAALVTSSILFALIHFDFTTIGKPDFINEIANIFSYLFAGFFFGYAYLRSENIVSNIALHATNNLVASLIIISNL